MDVPFDLLHIVASYYTKPRMKLLDWIPEDNLDWYGLSGNSNALHMLEANPMKIDWDLLSFNPNALHMLEIVLQHDPDKINWNYLSFNPNAIHMLEANKHI